MKIQIRSMSLNSHTIGKLSVDKEFFCYTLELPWLDNAKNVSCIPTGDYKIKMVNSPRFGSCYQIMNVDNRTHILIHAGNTVDDIEGCILLGDSCGVINGKEAVFSSRKSISAFNQLLGGRTHGLEIIRG